MYHGNSALIAGAATATAAGWLFWLGWGVAGLTLLFLALALWKLFSIRRRR